MQLTAGINQQITAEDSGTFSDTFFTFGLLTETRRQSLTADLGTRLRANLGNDLDARFTDPFVTLGYTHRLTSNTELDVALSYREEPVVKAGGNTGSTLAQVFTGGGERTDTDAKLTFTFGKQGPAGGTLSLGQSTLSFSDTSDPNLIDSETLSASLGLRFDVSPRVTLTPSASITDTTRTGGTDIRRERVGLGARLVFSDVLTGGVELGSTRLVDGGTTQTGATAVISLGLARPNGQITARLLTDIGPNGRRNNLLLGRSFENKLGSLSLGVGLTRAETDELRPLYNLSYSREAEKSRITASLSQEFNIDASGNEVLNSRLGLSFIAELTTQIRLTSSLGYSNSAVLSGTGVDSERFDASLGFSQELVSDWRLRGGVNYTQTRSNGTQDSKNELFLGLGRDFNWRP